MAAADVALCYARSRSQNILLAGLKVSSYVKYKNGITVHFCCALTYCCVIAIAAFEKAAGQEEVTHCQPEQLNNGLRQKMTEMMVPE